MRIRKPDTNIIAVKIDELIEASANEDSEPVFCEKCKAVLMGDIELKDRKWICEFCGNFNRISSNTNRQAISNDAVFALEKAKKTSKIDGEFVVYCIDISGSMNVTVENTDAQQEKRDEKYISRLFVGLNELKVLELSMVLNCYRAFNAQ